jgi:hypothetical protein
VKRRTFVLLSAVSAAALGFPSVGCRSRSPAADRALSRPLFLSRICDAKTIREIGIFYLARRTYTNTKDQIADLLLSDNSGKNGPTSSDSLSIVNTLQGKISQDFEKGNTVILKGWILSVTEAEQCALFSLTQK